MLCTSLNLIIQDNLNSNYIKDVISNCKEIVKLIKICSNATKIFKQEQKNEKENSYKLVQEVSTRWKHVTHNTKNI